MERRKVKNGEKSSSCRPLLFFVPYIFSRPFRLSLVPTICPWVFEDVGRLGRKKKKAWWEGERKKRGLFPSFPSSHRSPAREHSIFRLLLHVFNGIPSGKPVGAFAEEKALSISKLTRTPHRLDHESRNARFPRGHPSSETQGQLVGTIDSSWWQFTLIVNCHHEHPIVPTNCPWVSEDGNHLIWGKSIKAATS